VDFGPLLTGALLDARIFTLHPGLHGLGVLFVSALDEFLGREAPALEVFAHAANVQFDAIFLLDELAHGSAAPKKEVHLELFRAFVNDGALDAVFLGSREGTPDTRAAPAQSRSYS